VDEKEFVIIVESKLDEILLAIAQGRYKQVIIFVGAGISVSAGIPDFRSANGIYNTHCNAEDLFTLKLFRENPSILQKFICGMIRKIQNAQPTKFHKLMAELVSKRIVKRVYTQNIDGLERSAKIPTESLVELHGCLLDPPKCRYCGNIFPSAKLMEEIESDHVPQCSVCKRASIKPNITLFGGRLAKHFNVDDLNDCDLLLIVGTSLTVSPANELVFLVPPTTPIVFINKAEIALDPSISNRIQQFTYEADEIADHISKYLHDPH